MDYGSILLDFAIPIGAFVLGIYWNSRTAKRQDEEALKKEVARETTVDVKLDNISRTVTGIDVKLENMQTSINNLERKNSVLEEKLNEFDRRLNEDAARISEIKEQLARLHQEHRERVSHCEK